MGGRVDRGEKIDLFRVDHECRARWHHTGHGPAWDHLWVQVGTLADNRWYVDITGGSSRPAHVYPTKEDAWRVARNWMATRDDRWERVPCYHVGAPGANSTAGRLL